MLHSPLHLKQIYSHLKKCNFGQVFRTIIFLFKSGLGTRVKNGNISCMRCSKMGPGTAQECCWLWCYNTCAVSELRNVAEQRKPLVLLRIAVSLASQQPCRNEDPFSLLSASQTFERAVDQYQIQSHTKSGSGNQFQSVVGSDFEKSGRIWGQLTRNIIKRKHCGFVTA